MDTQLRRKALRRTRAAHAANKHGIHTLRLSWSVWREKNERFGRTLAAGDLILAILRKRGAENRGACSELIWHAVYQSSRAATA